VRLLATELGRVMEGVSVLGGGGVMVVWASALGKTAVSGGGAVRGVPTAPFEVALQPPARIASSTPSQNPKNGVIDTLSLSLGTFASGAVARFNPAAAWLLRPPHVKLSVGIIVSMAS
jgi:hypothetical protein